MQSSIEPMPADTFVHAESQPQAPLIDDRHVEHSRLQVRERVEPILCLHDVGELGDLPRHDRPGKGFVVYD